MEDILLRLDALERINQDLVASNQALRTQNAELTQQIVAQPSEPETEPKVAMPSKFDGSRKGFRGFISQVELVFMLNPKRYRTDSLKVGFIGTLLAGRALDWFTPLLENKERYTNVLDNYKEFKKAFESAFGEPDREQVAETAIYNLVQGKSSASVYAANFRNIAVDLSWNDPALIVQFRRGLNDDVKDMLLNHDKPKTLDEMINLAIRIDNRLFEHRAEMKSGTFRLARQGLAPSSPRPTSSIPVASSSTMADTGPVPMEIGTSRTRKLTQQERQHRIQNGLCLYCGEVGHKLANCPKSKSKSTTLQTTDLKQAQKMDIEGYLKFGSYSSKHIVLVDCGADDTCINDQIVKDLEIPLVKLPHPIKIIYADGEETRSNVITHRTIPLQLRLGDHIEMIQPYVTRLSRAVLLGIDWLQRHNPEIDWQAFTLKFHSEHCATNCCSTPLIVYGIHAPSESAKAPSSAQSAEAESSFVSHDVRTINANAFELNSKFSSDSQVGICFIRQTPDGISIASLDSVHQQLYPYIKPLPNEISSDAEFKVKMLQEFPDVFSKQNADILPEHRPYPDTSAPFVVETDASDFALGGVLSQYDKNQHLHPVAFFSRQLTSAERNYEIYDRELLAIHESFKEWRHFLQGAPHPVTILCDHRNLEYFTTTRSLNRRQARWYLFLSEFDFVLTYRPGKLNGKADSLSRRPDYLPSGGEDDMQENMVQVIKPSQLMALNFVISEDDSFIDKIRQETKGHHLLTTVASNDELELRDGLILKNGLVFVPTEELRLYVMKSRHDGLQAGHFGINKTLELILRDFWWPKMKADIQNYVRSCDCVRAKAPRHKPFGLLQALPIPKRPWASLSTDHIVELPSSCGFDAINVWVCRLTKQAHFIADKTTATASDFSENFVNHIFRLHGLPEDIISDRGSLFMSRFWKKTCEKLGINMKYSTSFHPQTDGQTERVNQTLEQYLRCFVNHNQDNWVKLLPLAEFAYNNSINASTGKSPFLANYGFHPRADLLNVKQQDFTIEYIVDGIEDIKSTLAEAQKKYKEYADAKRIDMEFNVGDQVWLLTKNIRTTRPSKKLDYRRLGPFKIIQKVGNVAYKLELPPSMKIHNVFHVSLLEPTIKNKFQGRIQEPPPPVEVEGDEEFEVEEILDSRLFRRHGQYLVHWTGYHSSEATWEPWEFVKNAPVKIQEFHAKYPGKPGPWH